jgi:hypothetical protein
LLKSKTNLVARNKRISKERQIGSPAASFVFSEIASYKQCKLQAMQVTRNASYKKRKLQETQVTRNASYEKRKLRATQLQGKFCGNFYPKKSWGQL